MVWYHTIQPLTRQQAWNINETFLPPFHVLPKHPEEWFRIKKAGPNGIFVFINALSWLPGRLTSPEDKATLEAILEDLAWVLGTMTCVEKLANVEGGKDNKKRKLVDIAASASKKKAKVNKK